MLANERSGLFILIAYAAGTSFVVGRTRTNVSARESTTFSGSTAENRTPLLLLCFQVRDDSGCILKLPFLVDFVYTSLVAGARKTAGASTTASCLISCHTDLSFAVTRLSTTTRRCCSHCSIQLQLPAPARHPNHLRVVEPENRGREEIKEHGIAMF